STISVIWEVAEDGNFVSIYKSDSVTTSPSHDYTVKVDVDALKPDRVYYYRFKALGGTSITGRTKTAPVTMKDSLRFAVVSCANWEWGYFNGYDKIADRPVLDGVLHLGDYIYEYASGKYGDTTIGRFNIPKTEVVSLHDYRTRYSLYRLDAGLRRVHQQHPFIAIWDDHEIANNSYTEGAQNHQPDEGDYAVRKAAAKQAYYEWIPIREGQQLYRSFSFGPLADVIMLDERLAGRNAPVDSLTDPRLNNPDRSMLGKDQLTWFENNLKASKAVWKVIGNQVIFSDVNLSAAFPKMPRNLDSWDGYPAEKKSIENFIFQNKIKDVIFTTGDTHGSWAIEVPDEIKKNYQALAVEFGTTSISSANGDEYKSADTVAMTELSVMKNNPHVKYINDRDHGYMLVTLSPTRALVEWFYTNTLRVPKTEEALGKSFIVEKGKVKLIEENE
ncbi:MAG TPA: alkaline phosphatase D family protein, partial [Cyclobacteriaceae bacterium]|nr:alkaline phosphatase D family protein [Cyclobacteriaceae bacterium]